MKRVYFYSLFLYLFPAAYGDLNLEFQVDGDTSNSSVAVDVKYEPGGALPLTSSSPIPSPVLSPQASLLATPSTAPASANTNTPLQTHVVQVGGRGELVFFPNTLNAAVGDVLQFKFLALNHTLTQSTLESPCEAANAFDTGFVHFNPTNRTDDILEFLVQNTDPQYFFCRQTTTRSHCKAGMVFGLNPGNTMDEFLANAQTPLNNNGASMSSSSIRGETGIMSATMSEDTNMAQTTPMTDNQNSSMLYMMSSQTIDIPSVVTTFLPTMNMSIVTSTTIMTTVLTLNSSGSVNTTTPLFPTPTTMASIVSRNERPALNPFISAATNKRHTLSGWLGAVVIMFFVLRRFITNSL